MDNVEGFYILNKDLPKPLSDEEIRELFRKMHLGDQNAEKTIIEHNLRLVAKYCSHFNGDMDEMFSDGTFALIRAVKKYDPERETSFAGYASTWIINTLKELYIKKKKDSVVESYDESLDSHDSSETSKLEMIPSTDNTESEYEQQAEREIIRKLVEYLPKEDRQIIMLYFGFIDNKFYNQASIAEKLNMSQGNVCKKIQRITELLKVLMTKLFNEDNQDQSIIYANSELQNAIIEMINDYSELEQKVFIDFFGLNGHEANYQKKIAKKYKLTSSEVYDIIKKIRDDLSEKIKNITGNNIYKELLFKPNSETAGKASHERRIKTIKGYLKRYKIMRKNNSVPYNYLTEKQLNMINTYLNDPKSFPKEEIFKLKNSISKLKNIVTKSSIKYKPNRSGNTIYEYLSEYSKTDIDSAMSKLPERYKMIIHRYFNPKNEQEIEENKNRNSPFFNIIALLVKIIENPNYNYKSQRNGNTVYDYFSDCDPGELDIVLCELNDKYRDIVYKRFNCPDELTTSERRTFNTHIKTAILERIDKRRKKEENVKK